MIDSPQLASDPNLSRVEMSDECARAAGEAVRYAVRRMLRKPDSLTNEDRALLAALVPVLEQRRNVIDEMIWTLSDGRFERTRDASDTALNREGK